jgi:hypothetical protein
MSTRGTEKTHETKFACERPGGAGAGEARKAALGR